MRVLEGRPPEVRPANPPRLWAARGRPYRAPPVSQESSRLRWPQVRGVDTPAVHGKIPSVQIAAPWRVRVVGWWMVVVGGGASWLGVSLVTLGAPVDRCRRWRDGRTEPNADLSDTGGDHRGDRGSPSALAGGPQLLRGSCHVRRSAVGLGGDSPHGWIAGARCGAGTARRGEKVGGRCRASFLGRPGHDSKLARHRPTLVGAAMGRPCRRRAFAGDRPTRR